MPADLWRNLQGQDAEGEFGEEAQAVEKDIPAGVAHLDFGSRDGGGVVGPKLDRIKARHSDKFEVHEGTCTA